MLSANPVDPNAAGVRGILNAPNADGYGVWGSHSGSGVGVYGTTAGCGTGVLGLATSGHAVTGQATTGTGIFGITNGGAAIVGRNNGSTRSVNGDQPGVAGTAFADDGGQFVSSKGNGICAAAGTVCSSSNAPDQAGVYAKSATGPGMVAEGSPPLRLVAPSPSSAPLQVSSSGRVTNLNADLLDGLDSTALPLGKRFRWNGSGFGSGTPRQLIAALGPFEIYGSCAVGGDIKLEAHYSRMDTFPWFSASWVADSPSNNTPVYNTAYGGQLRGTGYFDFLGSSDDLAQGTFVFHSYADVVTGTFMSDQAGGNCFAAGSLVMAR